MILRLYKPCNENPDLAQVANLRRSLFDQTASCQLALRMKRALALIFLLLVVCAAVQAQGPVLRDRAGSQIIEDATADQVLAARAIVLLKRLDDEVIVYRSLGEFEESGKLARVPFADFQRDLAEISTEVQQLVSRLPDRQLKSEISNALASYRDGAYWWQRIYQPRVVRVSELTASDKQLTPSDSFFTAGIPYTVAIHWRQANRHLVRAVRAAGLS